MKAKNKIFIYLARRDKRGVKVLLSFATKSKTYPIKIENINKLIELGLSKDLIKKLNTELRENNMLNEMWIESSEEGYEGLKRSLAKRGYRNLPFRETNFYITNNISKINKDALLDTRSTMLRKKK